jgi:hypothetical protein
MIIIDMVMGHGFYEPTPFKRSSSHELQPKNGIWSEKNTETR